MIKRILAIAVCTLIIAALSTPFLPSQAHEEMAHIHLGHFVAGAPYVDVSLGEMSLAKAVEPRTVTDFQEVGAGTYKLAITADGKAVVDPSEITLVAGHNYSISIVGDAAKGKLQALLLDEIATAEACDISKHVLRVIVNNVVGLDALSFYENNMWVEKNIKFGMYSAECSTPFKWDTGKAVAGEDLDTIVFDFDHDEDGVGGFWEPYTVYYYGVMGKYPGKPDEDYYFAGGSPYVLAPDSISFLSAFTGLKLNSQESAIYEFTTAIKALKAAGLDKTLASDGPYTLFVPIDMAFDKLPAGTLQKWMNDPAALADVLKYHIVKGATNYDDLVATGKVKTLQGGDLTIEASTDDGLTFKVNGASVANFPYVDLNGNTVWFINDQVLMPTSK